MIMKDPADQSLFHRGIVDLGTRLLCVAGPTKLGKSLEKVMVLILELLSANLSMISSTVLYKAI